MAAACMHAALPPHLYRAYSVGCLPTIVPRSTCGTEQVERIAELVRRVHYALLLHACTLLLHAKPANYRLPLSRCWGPGPS